ncbi:hypothetical protein V1639_05275 [Pseudarthrobacter sp. J75]|nr:MULTISPECIES: hypothetical protein [unclassified Pseudarthrobacter]MEE2521209.1 hypothetical protein [Pseudarthrobacter sp. J47]MEE2528441.1 hypothetical protein [Pseudarthrobacter sp. J75]
MTTVAEPDYFEDYRSNLDSRYEEGFGQGPDLDDDDEGSAFDELDSLLNGLFDDDDEDFDEPVKAPAAKAVKKAPTAAKAAAPKKAAAGTPKVGPVITRRVAPAMATVQAPVAPAVEQPAAAKAAAPAPEAPVVPVAPVLPAVEEPAVAEAPAEAVPDLPDSPFFAPHIAPVNQHVEFLRKLRPGLEVPYVDPMHSVEECRIISLFSNTGEASPQGVVWAGDDAAATRLLGLQFQLGLRPEWIMPWNTYPWFTPGEANGKLTPEQVNAGLKPLISFLRLVPRASAIVAHGTEANRLAQMLLKTDNPMIWRRGLKVYKARPLHGRTFAGSKDRHTELLIDMGRSYADAMARAGLQAGRR